MQISMTFNLILKSYPSYLLVLFSLSLSPIIQVPFIHYLEFAQYLLSTTKFYNNICGRTNCVYYFNLNDLKHFAAGHSYSQVPGDLVTTSWMQFKIKAKHFSLHWNIVVQIMQLKNCMKEFYISNLTSTILIRYIMLYIIGLNFLLFL